jgi:hypothetical protein
MNLCARCGVNFPTVTTFDAHPCMTASPGPAATAVLREKRRTSIVTIGPDTVRLCEPECRNEVLLDLGVKGGRGAWVYPPRGPAVVTVTWSGKTYEVTWKRCPPSAQPCDLCAHQWHYRIPAAVAAAGRAPTEAQRASLARARQASGLTARLEARNRENPAA